jgi:hypothetical protein
VAGQERLHEQASGRSFPSWSDQPGGPHEQRHRLLGGTVARGEQLEVDVEEGDDVGALDAVQHGFGADVHTGGRRWLGVPSRHGDDRPAGGGLQLLAQPCDPGLDVGERRAPAHEARRWPYLATPPADQVAVVGEPDRGLAALATHERPARAAGEDPGPARRVVHAHDGLFSPAEMGDQ